MMNTSSFDDIKATPAEKINQIQAGNYDGVLSRLYGEDITVVECQKNRYIKAIEAFAARYGDQREIALFSAPGRTEIGGNHTDHNHGCVLAAGIDLDVIGVAARSDHKVACVKSEGFEADRVEWNDGADLAPVEAESGKAISLLRGMIASFIDKGCGVGGFDAYTTSNVLKGSGLSSSAAYEVLLGNIINTLYNSGETDAVEIAIMSQYSENVYFGKPCGLMDQAASSVGGIVTMDFNQPAKPIIREVSFDFAHSGYKLCIVDTGGNHADLTPEYAAITEEMKLVANFLGVDYLRSVSFEKLFENMVSLREKFGDRAVLRAAHFLHDNARVGKQVSALEAGNFEEFKRLIIESGHSSFEYLQNVYPSSHPQEQGLSLALMLAQRVLDGKGAWRVHGGGFAGTTQNFVPADMVAEFKATMEAVFGEGSCYILGIRPVGGVCLG